jgi:hypothetical protein
MEEGETTHPLSGSRIAAIANRLETEAPRFVDRNDENPARTAEKLRHHGRLLRDLAVPKLINPEERKAFLELAARHNFRDLARL